MSPKIAGPCVLLMLLSASAIYAAPPTYTWGHGYGDEDTQTLSSVATDPAGNILICGGFYSTITIKTTLTSAGNGDAFIAKLDPNGNALWNRRMGTITSNDVASDVTSDENGNVIAVGGMNPTVTTGLKATIVKYDAAGAQLWVKSYGAMATSNEALGVTTDLAGNIIVAGSFQGFVDFGGDTLYPPSPHFDGLFLAKFDSNGNHTWSKAFAWDYANTALGGLAADAMGNVFLYGQFATSIDLGGGVLTSSGLTDLFLAKFAGDGRAIWSSRYGSAAGETSACLAVTTDGRAAIGTSLYSAVDFGGGALVPTGNPEPAVALFNPSGSHLWSKTFTSTTYGFATGLSFADNNDLLLTCTGQGTINFGGGPVAATGINYNVFVSRLLSGNGGHRWSFAFAGDDNVTGTVTAGRNAVIVAGSMDGAANPGGGALPWIGGSDIFVAKYGETLTGVSAPPLMIATLGQNVPNPFNPTTSIPYTLERGANVVIGIYDASGTRVAQLSEGLRSPGAHSAMWSGRDASGGAVASGVYFYRLEGAGDISARKMILLK